MPSVVERVRTRVRRSALKRLSGLRNQVRIAFDIELDEHFEVGLQGEIPVRARLTKAVGVRLRDAVHATADIKRTLNIPVEEILTVPLDLELEIVLDTDVLVQDLLYIETIVAIDTVVTAMGVAPIPIQAKIPIKLEVPLDQPLRIRGNVRVPVRQVLQVPVSHTFRVPINESFPVTVHIDDEVPVSLDVELDAKVNVDADLPVHLKQTLRVDGRRVTVSEIGGEKSAEG